jgi:putative ABC transport system ATP-binding protein
MLELDHVRKFYSSPGEPIRAVDDLCVSVAAGEFVAIFGPSGSGKSTLLMLMAGVIPPDSGYVRFEGVDVWRMSKAERLRYRRSKIGLVFQSFNLFAGLTAAENVQVPLLLQKADNVEGKRRVSALLADVDLSQRAGHAPDRLSGGEQQRVAIARALVGEPKLLLADEPTGNLDSASGARVLELMRQTAEKYGTGAVIVTHDPAVAELADRVLAMHDGRLVSYDPAAQPIASGE